MCDRLSIIELTEKIEQQLHAIEYIVSETSGNQTNTKVSQGLFFAVLNCTESISKLKDEIEQRVRGL